MFHVNRLVDGLIEGLGQRLTQNPELDSNGFFDLILVYLKTSIKLEIVYIYRHTASFKI